VRLAEALVEALKLLGVRYVFGVSGANIEHLHDAIHRLGNGRLRSVLAKGEAGAAFMADGHARVHRSLGVCASTSGGGMVNLLAGLAESYQSSSPVLAIVGQPPTTLRGRGAFQDSSGLGRSVSALGLLGALTKYVRELTDPEEFWPSLDAAIIAALSNRQGTSALLIPRDLFEREVPAPGADWCARILARAKPSPVGQESFVRVFELVRNARRPMLIIGQGIRRSRNPDAVRKFAARTGIPVATTMSARAEYPNDAPNYLGVLGAAGHPSVHSYLCDEADVVLAVGASMNAMTSSALLRSANGLAGKTLIVVNSNLDDVQRALGASSPVPAAASRAESPRSRLPALLVGVEADAGPSFETLNELWEREPFVVPRLDRECLQFTPTLAREACWLDTFRKPATCSTTLATALRLHSITCRYQRA
jgi:acetolactate synthase-1/2/3 large subunit